MIEIYADGKLIYDSRLRTPGKDYSLLGLTTTKGLNKGGTAQIAVPPKNPIYSGLVSYRTVVDIFRDGLRKFRGRALYPTDDWMNRRTWMCEGELCFFQDGTSRPYLYQDTPQAIFTAVVEDYNSQVEEFKRFKVGTITVTDSNDYVRLESEKAEQTLDTLNKLIDRCGGYITFTTDSSTNERVVNWLAEVGVRSTQPVEFGKNLLDFARTGSDTDLITAIIPYGAVDEETKQRVDITSVNNGLDYIQDDEAVAIRGTISRPVYWDDVTEPSNLLSKAQAYLHAHRTVITSLTLTAVDLSRMDKSIDSFQLGDYIPVISKPHAVNDYFQLTDYTEDLLRPDNSQITLGADVKSLTYQTNSEGKATDKLIQNTVNNLKDSVSAEVETIRQTVLTQNTEVVNTAEQIILSALERYVETGDFEEFRRTVSSELEVLAERISMNFETTTDQVSTVNGDLQTVSQRLEKHFDFTVNGVTIRAGENSMNLVLDNDLIRFTKNGQQFGWWDGVNFHTGNIVVEVNERAQFGNFAFVPRSNGSLSFLKVNESNAAERTLLAISATYRGGPVPTGTSLSSLTGLTVTASYSDNSTETVGNYSMSGVINVGSNTITVSYGGKVTSFTVVGEPLPNELVSISATYSGGNVPQGTALNSLTGITVTAHYYDGSTEAVTGYTLSGSIAPGSNTITVSYGGKTATFTVYCESTGERTLESISATYSGGAVPVGTLVESLSGITVTAHYSDGSTSIVGGASRSGTINEGGNIITLTYQGKTTTITVVGVATASTGITLGPATSVIVAMWMNTAVANKTVEYAHNVDIVDGAVAFINGSTRTFYPLASGKTNNYDILLGRYVKATDGNIYYINPDSTYTHTTNSTGLVKESIGYQNAQLVSVA